MDTQRVLTKTLNVSKELELFFHTKELDIAWFDIHSSQSVLSLNCLPKWDPYWQCTQQSRYGSLWFVRAHKHFPSNCVSWLIDWPLDCAVCGYWLVSAPSSISAPIIHSVMGDGIWEYWLLHYFMATFSATAGSMELFFLWTVYVSISRHRQWFWPYPLFITGFTYQSFCKHVVMMLFAAYQIGILYIYLKRINTFW